MEIQVSELIEQIKKEGVETAEAEAKSIVDAAKIDAENYASQRLFEKLGATPYGIAEHMLHKEEDIIRCEEENLDEIDDKLIQLAEKFGVEPRKLLSHVLEYELNW